MRKLAFFLVTVVGCLTVESASADSLNIYINGNNCHPATILRTPSGFVLAGAGYSQYGINAWETPIDVICPFTLPWQWLNSVTLKISGYNRSYSDTVSCSLVTNWRADGTLPRTLVTTALKLNGQAWQTASNSAIVGSTADVYLTCHLPALNPTAGGSHLTAVFLKFDIGGGGILSTIQGQLDPF